MNRTEIAHQVSLTLGDSVDSFDIDGIVDDLIAAHDGDLNSIDDFDSQSYWAIVETHDTGTQAEAKAEKAHTYYLQAEVAYKTATVARQVAFAQAIDAMGRGGQAILSNKVGLSAPTVKSIADRGRQALAHSTDAGAASTIRSAADLAAEHRDYAYDLDHGGRELHRLHPELSGLYRARMLLWKAATEKWEEENPDALFGMSDTPVQEAPVGLDFLVKEYERRVNAIAEGKPLPLAY